MEDSRQFGLSLLAGIFASAILFWVIIGPPRWLETILGVIVAIGVYSVRFAWVWRRIRSAESNPRVARVERKVAIVLWTLVLTLAVLALSRAWLHGGG